MHDSAGDLGWLTGRRGDIASLFVRPNYHACTPSRFPGKCVSVRGSPLGLSVRRRCIGRGDTSSIERGHTSRRTEIRTDESGGFSASCRVRGVALGWRPGRRGGGWGSVGGIGRGGRLPFVLAASCGVASTGLSTSRGVERRTGADCFPGFGFSTLGCLGLGGFGERGILRPCEGGYLGRYLEKVQTWREKGDARLAGCAASIGHLHRRSAVEPIPLPSRVS